MDKKSQGLGNKVDPRTGQPSKQPTGGAQGGRGTQGTTGGTKNFSDSSDRR